MTDLSAVVIGLGIISVSIREAFLEAETGAGAGYCTGGGCGRV